MRTRWSTWIWADASARSRVFPLPGSPVTRAAAASFSRPSRTTAISALSSDARPTKAGVMITERTAGRPGRLADDRGCSRDSLTSPWKVGELPDDRAAGHAYRRHMGMLLVLLMNREAIAL